MIAFLAIILIPVVLTGVAVCFLLHYKVQAIGREYGIENPTYESIYNNSLMISKMMDAEFQSLKQQAEEHPEQLEDNAYLNQLNEELAEDNTYLAVRKGDSIYYNGSTTVSDHKLLEALPPVGGIVTMGCNVQCPLLPCKWREDWGLDDPTGQPDAVFLEIIRQIEEKILQLKESLS